MHNYIFCVNFLLFQGFLVFSEFHLKISFGQSACFSSYYGSFKINQKELENIGNCQFQLLSLYFLDFLTVFAVFISLSELFWAIILILHTVRLR